jgi:O-antigen ligase
MKPLALLAFILGSGVALYALLHYLQLFSDVTFLGGFLLLEIIAASIWNYEQRFLILMLVAFLWAGMSLPIESAWTLGRWLVLAAGSAVGFVIWTRNPRQRFGSLHLISFFCVGSAFVSASVSLYVRMASLKALSLLLLFLYCATGARLAVIGREDRFFRGLLWACEVLVYATAISYFGLGQPIWGNPNSLGAAMSVGVFPLLLWGWLVGDERGRVRRFIALLLCAYLTLYSGARAGMMALVAVTLTFSFCLHQYKLLLKVTAMALLLIACAGVFAPRALTQRLEDLTDLILYKGHKEEGILGSRKTPWEKSTASIKQHPLFGTGYGTSPSGENPGSVPGLLSSTAETAREHGSSYMTIAEWVGLLGGLPFVGLLAVTVLNLWKVCRWMKRTREPRHYSIPLAMVVLAGLVHAGFEDWLFAVGYYLCVYFWIMAFFLADFLPRPVELPAGGVVPRASLPSPLHFAPVAPPAMIPNLTRR